MVATSATSANVDAEPMSRIEPQADQQDEPKPEVTSDFMLENRDHIASTSTVLDSGTTTPKPKELPPLPYSLRDHKLSISIIWTLLFLDTAVLPIALFYPLWFATDEPPWEVITITSCIFGVISGAEWLYRTWKLWRDETVRPFGSRSRWHFDFFHISYTIGYGIALLELIIGAAPNWPIIRLCALPTPSFILFFGILILLFSLFDHRRWPVPFKISSLAKGAGMRPCTYVIIEDVLAVDTGLGRRYRKALSERYQASPVFRKMLRHMDLFWGVSAVVVGVACFVLVLDGNMQEEVAYGLGWGIPPVWAGVWAVVTIKWVQRTLRKEAQMWDEASKGNGNV